MVDIHHLKFCTRTDSYIAQWLKNYVAYIPCFVVLLYITTWLGYCTHLPRAKHPVRTAWMPAFVYVILLISAYIIGDLRPEEVCVPNVFTYYGLPLTEICGVWLILLVELSYGEIRNQTFACLRWWLLVVTIAGTPIAVYLLELAYAYQILASIVLSVLAFVLIVWSDEWGMR